MKEKLAIMCGLLLLLILRLLLILLLLILRLLLLLILLLMGRLDMLLWQPRGGHLVLKWRLRWKQGAQLGLVQQLLLRLLLLLKLVTHVLRVRTRCAASERECKAGGASSE